MDNQIENKKIPWHRNIKWYHLWIISILSFSLYFLFLYIYESEYFLLDIVGVLSLIFAIVETIKAIRHSKNKTKILQKIKGFLLVFCVYILTAYIISLFQKDDYGDQPFIIGMFFSIFATPLIIYLWNKYTKNKESIDP